jgi:hypothetical protein
MFRWLNRWLVFAAVAAVAFVAAASPVMAQIAPDGDVSPDAPSSAYLTVNNTLVLILTGAVIPIVNGLLLRPENPSWVKVLIASLVGTAVHAFSQVVQADGTAVLTQEWTLGLVITLGSMVATYLGVWKPAVDPNAKLPSLLPRFG